MPEQITIVGLGPAGVELLPSANLNALRGAKRILVRTERHPAVSALRAQGFALDSLDRLYEQSESFAELYPALAEAVLSAAETEAVVYAVPGHPLLGEESVRLVLRLAGERGITARVLAAPGFVDVVATALAAAGELPDLTEWQVVDAAALDGVWWDVRKPTLVFQVDDTQTASSVKLALMEEYPDDFPVLIVRSAGDPTRELVTRLPLHQSDQLGRA